MQSNISTPATPVAGDRQWRMVLQIIHSYTLILHLALPAVLFVLFPRPLADALTSEPVDQILSGNNRFALGAALLFIGLSQIVPKMWVNATQSTLSSTPKPGNPDIVGRTEAYAYLLKICLLELCVIAGFVAALMAKSPGIVLPFAGIGLVLTLLSPPSAGAAPRSTPTQAP